MENKLNRCTAGIWRMLAIVLAIALAINAVQVLLGKARLAYWHWFTLAIVWSMATKTNPKEKSRDGSGFRSCLTPTQGRFPAPSLVLTLRKAKHLMRKIGMKMRVELSTARTIRKAKKENPWAVKIVKVKGGFLCFENYANFLVWNDKRKKQEQAQTQE